MYMLEQCGVHRVKSTVHPSKIPNRCSTPLQNVCIISILGPKKTNQKAVSASVSEHGGCEAGRPASRLPFLTSFMHVWWPGFRWGRAEMCTTALRTSLSPLKIGLKTCFRHQRST
jgi:hypothetical protein